MSFADLPSFDSGTSGSWLYQHNGNLYGPLSTQALLDRMRLGQIGDDISVSPDGADDFVPILSHPVLKTEAAKAIEEGEARKKKLAATKRKAATRTVMLVVTIISVCVLGAGGFFGYKYWENQKKIARLKKEYEATLERQKVEAEARRGAELAQAAAVAEPELDLDVIPLVKVVPHKKKAGKKGGSMVDEGPQGCQLDPGQIAATWRTGFPALKACVKAQMGRSDDTPEALTLEFVIANDGSVSGFDIDDRSVKGSPFADCLKKAVTGLRFPKFPGERCNIAYPITIGKKR